MKALLEIGDLPFEILSGGMIEFGSADPPPLHYLLRHAHIGNIVMRDDGYQNNQQENDESG